MVEVGPIPEEALRCRGCKALRARLPPAELQFPRRPNGSALLLKESLYERLIAGKTPLSSFPASDVSAAQGDLRHLSLEQLLAVHRLQGDAPTASATAAGNFWAAAENAISERLASRLQRTSEVASLVLLVYGALDSFGDALPAADHWLLEKELLNLRDCILVPLEEVATYCHSNLIKGGPRRKVHWEVQRLEKPSDFKEKPRGSLRTRPKAKGYPAPCPVPAASESEETASDSGPEPGSRPRVVTAGLCSSEEAAKAAARRGEAQVLVELREELKVSRASEALAQEELQRLREEHEKLMEVEAKAQVELSKAKEELDSVRAAEAKAQEDLSKVKDELAAMTDSEVKAQEELSKAKEELDSVRDAEAKAQEDLSKVKDELASMTDSEAKAQEELSKTKEELDAARAAEAALEDLTKVKDELASVTDSEAKAQEELSKAKEELDSVREAEAKAQEDLSKVKDELASVTDSEAKAQEELSKTKEELHSVRAAEANAREELSKAKDEPVSTSLREELAKANEELASMRESQELLREELKAARDLEAAARDEVSKLLEKTSQDRELTELKAQLIEAKDAEAETQAELAKLRERLAETPAEAAVPDTQWELITAKDIEETKDESPVLKGKLEATVEAVLAKDEDQESFASFESCEGGMVWRSPLKEP